MTNLSEKEKMLAGMQFDAGDSVLAAERKVSKDLCFLYNQLLPSEIKKRANLMKKLLGKTKGSFLIEQPFYCDYGYNIEIGERFYANVNVVILDCAKVTFGDHVFIGPNCGFYTVNHPFNIEERNKGWEYALPITIGNGVWIGAGSSILPGVNIGDHTVIGAGSVVTKSITSGVLAAGNPCRVIRKLN